jgi:hypothetical protein
MSAGDDLRAGMLTLMSEIGRSVTLRRGVGANVEDFAFVSTDPFNAVKAMGGGSLRASKPASVYVAASGMPTTPVLSDKILVDGRAYGVVAIAEYKMSGVVSGWLLSVADVGVE